LTHRVHFGTGTEDGTVGVDAQRRNVTCGSGAVTVTITGTCGSWSKSRLHRGGWACKMKVARGARKGAVLSW
jgi:hypothetical protein